MPCRVLLIQPSHYRSKTDHSIIKVSRRSLVPLALPYLAALAPAGWEVKLVDEIREDLPPRNGFDLVAITTHTLTSYRAYDLARHYREQGARVILGGPHVFFYPEEAAQHADAIAVGEGEGTWRKMLEDAAANRLQRIYRPEQLSDLKGLPLPRYDLLNLHGYGYFKTFAVQTTRGCPFTCDFCSERLYLGSGFRCRPVPEVIAEIKHTRSRLIFFAESNFGGHRAYALELMEALIPLKLRWSTLWSMNLCGDKQFMDLAQRSGLLHVNVGLESIDGQTIAGMNKRQNQVPRYKEILADLRGRGVSYSLNFIFGWDTETADVFQSTLRFLEENNVPVAYFNILTPTKPTAYYDRMLQEDRIINREDIDRYPGQFCHIKQSYCTPEEMVDKVKKLERDFYRWGSILRRLPAPVTTSNIVSWVLNFSMRKMARQKPGEMEFEGF